ncbi:MAG TPA: fasciclin domain-containing protein [Gemmataceae bacterium]|nr:fasciclin domain-containing protein [Gemmataceae bacterium]
MTKRMFGLAVVAAAALLTPGAAEEKKDLVATAAEGGQFQSFTTAVQEAGLAPTLKGKGPFTVFAPTDAAFKKVPEATMKGILTDREKLKKLVMAHVVAGRELRAADVAKMSGQKVNGFEVKAGGDKVTVGKATLEKADITCSNGVIHAIDAVLVPE